MVLFDRLRRATPRKLARHALAQARRGQKYLWQRRHLDRGVPKLGVFVVGCQRSGTNMLTRVIDRSPHAWVYPEDPYSAAFRDHRLRSPEVVDRLIRRSVAPTVAFKPICDSHLTDELVARHERSKAIWIYRGYRDVANSAVKNWGTHQVDIARWIVERNWEILDWRGERLGTEVDGLIRRVYRAEMSPQEGAALFWYTRNHFYFELGLDEEDRVLLVQYEDLVAHPAEAFRRVFEFIRCPFDPAFVSDVFLSSIGKTEFPAIDPRIESACEELQARLDTRYAEQSERWSGPR